MNVLKTALTLLGTVVLMACGSQTPSTSQEQTLEPNVINGTASVEGARPYQVALLRSSDGFQFCGGTLISNTWVLTAAHCVVGRTAASVNVRAGSLYPTSGGQVVGTSQIVVHPGYNSGTLQNDIALMRLNGTVNTPNAAPASLPTTSIEGSVAAPGHLLTISGWGRYTTSSNAGSSYLREANLPVLSLQQCQAALGSQVTGSMICGNINTQTQTGCHGDSGGPFATRASNRFYVFGVVSWGKSTCNNATAFTRVTSYTDWIQQTSGIGADPGTPNTVQYEAHVAGLGWMGWVSNGAVAGTTGQSRRMEAFRMLPGTARPNLVLQYRAHVAGLGWMGWVSNGAVAGTTGQSRQMEALQLQLAGDRAGCTVQYRAHVAELGWLPWVSEGQVAGTTGQGRRMEAMQVNVSCN